MDRGAWWAIVHGDHKELDTAEQLTLSLLFFLELFERLTPLLF